VKEIYREPDRGDRGSGASPASVVAERCDENLEEGRFAIRATPVQEHEMVFRRQSRERVSGGLMNVVP
jgi:hypothetical protein